MPVQVLLIAHQTIGNALISAAISIFGELPLPTMNIAVSQDIDPQKLLPQLQQILTQAGESGILILTDLLNATPCNIGKALNNNRARIVSGVNLPMLIDIMNYPDLALEPLAEKAVVSGRKGIVMCEAHP